MDILNKRLDKIGFKQYVADYHFGAVPPNKIVLHHTYKPTIESWNGAHTMEGMKRTYEKKGWDAGPHIFIAPDGIWLFTAMSRVGIHAGVGNATYFDKILRKNYYGWKGKLGNGTARHKLTECSIGIEMVGFYDHKKPSGKILDQTLFVIKTLMGSLDLKHDSLSFHRDWYGANKSCPGWAVTKEWIYKQLEDYEKPPPIDASVPGPFKDNFVWNPDEPADHLSQVRKLYTYHRRFHDRK